MNSPLHQVISPLNTFQVSNVKREARLFIKIEVWREEKYCIKRILESVSLIILKGSTVSRFTFCVLSI